MNIYERIKARRIELNMTQQELAQKVGYKSRSAINKIEKGLRDITQSQIVKFAAALSTTTSYLLDGARQNNIFMRRFEQITTFGERVKARRIELGLSIDMLAEKINKNRATIYRYESNEIENMSIMTLEPLAKALNTTPAYLMGWENSADISIEKTSNNYNSAPNINILNKYNKLNNNGQIKAESYIDGLLENPNYVKKEERPVNDNEPSEKIKLAARTGKTITREISKEDKDKIGKLPKFPEDL